MKLSYLPAVSLAVLTPIVALSPADAQPPSAWRVLASRTLGVGSSRDSVNTRSSNRYRQIQVCARLASISLNNYTVRFDNGRQQTIPVHGRVTSGACTRITSLTSGPRWITRIDFSYQRIPHGQRAPQLRVMTR